MRRPTSRAVAGLAVSAALAALVVAGAPGRGTSATSAGETVTPVASHELPNVPGSSLSAAVVAYEPGGRSAPHHHAGSVFAFVLEGAIRSKLDDGSEEVYQAGQSFFEPPGTRHAVSENASTTEPARLLAIILAETGATLTTFEE